MASTLRLLQKRGDYLTSQPFRMHLSVFPMVSAVLNLASPHFIPVGGERVLQLHVSIIRRTPVSTLKSSAFLSHKESW
jgi:hypothetical protein